MRSATLLLARAAGMTLFSLAPMAAPGQSQDSSLHRPDEESVCLGFAFGGFVPKLDWEKAGHRPVRDSSSLQHAPAGRDWAADIALRRDSALYLFPSWWPVGVVVELSNRRPAVGDTVSGRAIALVARGDIEPPVAKVKAWRVPCGAAPRTSSADSARSREKSPQKKPVSTGTGPTTSGILRRSP